MSANKYTMSALLLAMIVPASLPAQDLEANRENQKEDQPDIKYSGFEYPELPQGVASFGAAVSDGWLYICGGHVGSAHNYSTDDLTNEFWKVNLNEGGKWQRLAFSPRVQGFALVAHDGYLYRMGGMTATNLKDHQPHIYSTNGVERYDPTLDQWESLTPLPEKRSSFDAVVHQDKIYVIGGWQLGKEDVNLNNAWHSSAYVAELTKEVIEWKRLPDPPAPRRAIAVACAGDHLVVIGGITPDGPTSRDVWLFDLKTNEWSKGPDYPADEGMKGFGSSAFGIRDHVYASASDGQLFALHVPTRTWHATDFKLEKPRFFHRLITAGNEDILFIGGASRTGMIHNVESVKVANLRTTPLEAKEKIVEADDSQRDEPTRPGPPRRGEREEPAVPPSEPISQSSKNWPGFRGYGNSHALAAGIPTQWSEQQNLAWSIDLPGYGQSSPVVWGDRAFVTAVDGKFKDQLIVLCIDLKSGDIAWRKDFQGTQKVEDSDYVSKAAPTPVVDGERIYAMFESGDVIAITHKGEFAWHRSLVREYGAFLGNHGIGSSLAQTNDGVFVLIDHAGPGYLLKLNKQTGENLWKIDRQRRVSWSSPIIASNVTQEEPAAAQVLVSSNGIAEAFDATDGAPLWLVGGLEKNTIASPTVVDHSLLLIGASDNESTVAIRRDVRGGITSASVAWAVKDASPCGFSSPLVVDGLALYVNKAGVATCVDTADGKTLWRQRLHACWASPTLVGGRVYFCGNDGTTTVTEITREGLNIIATNTLPVDESRVYGLAVVDGSLLIRTGRNLHCVRDGETIASGDRAADDVKVE